MPAPVSVIIPAWNLWHMTRDCLESLARHTPRGSIEVVVVDNGSTDETATALEPTGALLFGDYFTPVRLPENQGFARGCNAGAQAASGELLFFLNNDTLVTENWLPPLCAALRDSPFMGMVGPLLLYPGSEEVQHCGVATAPTRYVDHLYECFHRTHPVVRKHRLLQAITGAAILLPANLFAQCGQFHEGYKNGCEDLDLCCTVRKSGKHLTCVPESVIYHLVSQTPGRSDNDDSNFDLLKQRWPAGLTPDLHRFALEDGFVPRLTATLNLCLYLPDETAQALSRTFAERFDAGRCHARLEAEPLWQEGYVLLARHMEALRQWADACNLYTRLTHFFPLAQNFAMLARAASRCGNASLVQYASAKTRQCSPTAGELAQKAAHIRSLLQAYIPLQDTALLNIFRQWLADYESPQKGASCE